MGLGKGWAGPGCITYRPTQVLHWDTDPHESWAATFTNIHIHTQVKTGRQTMSGRDLELISI